MQTLDNIVYIDPKPPSANLNQQQASGTRWSSSSLNQKSSEKTPMQLAAPSTPSGGSLFRPIDISYKSTPAKNIRNNNKPDEASFLQSASFLSSSSFSSVLLGNQTTATGFLPSQSYASNHSLDSSASPLNLEIVSEKQQHEQQSIQLLIDILFKFEQLEINFLADVDKPLKEIGTVCFNDYELKINKNELQLTVVKMKLKSLSLTDKLSDPSNPTYLLWSDSALMNTGGSGGAAHNCLQHSSHHHHHNSQHVASTAANANFCAATKSFSHENLHLTHKMRKLNFRQRNSSHKSKTNKKRQNDFLNNMFELTQYYGQLSTSLPSELSDSFSSNMKNKVDDFFIYFFRRL